MALHWYRSTACITKNISLSWKRISKVDDDSQTLLVEFWDGDEPAIHVDRSIETDLRCRPDSALAFLRVPEEGGLVQG